MQQVQEQDYSQKFNLGLWRSLLRHAKEYYKHLIILAVCMAISALCDVIFPLMTSYAIDFLIYDNPTGKRDIIGKSIEAIGNLLFQGSAMGGFIFVYIAILAVQVATIYAFLYLGAKIETGVCFTIRKKAFHKLQELPFAYYDRMPVGHLMSRMTSDIQRLSETIGWSLLDLCWGAVMLVMCSVTMLSINWKLGLAVMVVLPPLAVISFYFQKKILKSWRVVRKTNSRITGSFNVCQQIWKTQQWPQACKRSVFIAIPKKGNAKECSNYLTIALIPHVSKVMLKILQTSLSNM